MDFHRTPRAARRSTRTSTPSLSRAPATRCWCSRARAIPHARNTACVKSAATASTIAWVNNTFSRTTSFADTYRNDGVRRVAAPIIEGFAPDVAHVHHLTCLSTEIVRDLAAIGIPVFFTLHDYWLICHRGQLLDRQLNVCSGPEPSGCGACLGSAAGVGAGVYAARSVLTIDGARAAVCGDAPAPRGRRVRGRRSRPRRAASARSPLRAWPTCATWPLTSRTSLRHPGSCGTDSSPSASILRASLCRSTGARSSPIARQPGAAAAPLRLGFLGSLMVSKAPHLLLEAASGLPQVPSPSSCSASRWTITATRATATRLAPLLSHPHVHVRGRIAHDDVARVLSNLDVLVVPSIWPENSPLVIREAFLAGVPVVASRIGGIPETVTDGVNGLLFDPGDAADLRRHVAAPGGGPGTARDAPAGHSARAHPRRRRGRHAQGVCGCHGRPAPAAPAGGGGPELPHA